MAVVPDSHTPDFVTFAQPRRERSASGELGRFAVVGGLGYAVNLAVFALLERWTHAGHAASATGAFAVAVASNYGWNRRWTFQGSTRPVGRQGLRFLAVSFVGLLADLAALHLLVRLSAPPLLGQAVGVVVAMPMTFLGCRLWSFPEDDAASTTTPAPVVHAPPVSRPRVVVCMAADGDGREARDAVDAVAAALGDDRAAVVAVAPGAGVEHARLAALRYATSLEPGLVVQVNGGAERLPAHLPALIAAAEGGSDIVLASPRGHGWRHALRRGITRLASVALRLPLRELHADVACFRGSVLAQIDLARVRPRRAAFLSELAYRSHASVAEVPVDLPRRPSVRDQAEALVEASVRLAELRLAALGARIGRYAWIVRWWALSRALVLVPALVVQLLTWPRPSWYPPVLDRPFALLGAWDGRWYRMVAARGYFVIPHHQSDTAFFPLFPITMRALHALGVSLTAAGLVLANLGLLLGLVALYELSRTWLAEPEARRTVVYAALFPAGFVYSMVYPEGLVLAMVAWAGVLGARRAWGGAAVLAALATLARPEGVFLALPFAALARRQWPDLDEGGRVRALWAVLAAPVSLAALCAYYAKTTGDPLAFSHAQLAWGRWTSVDGISRALHELVNASALDRQWLYRDAVFCAVYLAALLLALRARVPPSWVVAGAFIVLLPLWSGSFTSDARFGLLALPVYCGLAWLARRRWLDLTLRVASGVVLAASSATILLHWP